MGKVQFYKKLIDEKRLVNTIYAYNMELKDLDCLCLLLLQNEGIDTKEIEKRNFRYNCANKRWWHFSKDIEKIKINTKADFIFSLESSSEVASLYGSYLVRDNIQPF